MDTPTPRQQVEHLQRLLQQEVVAHQETKRQLQDTIAMRAGDRSVLIEETERGNGFQTVIRQQWADIQRLLNERDVARWALGKYRRISWYALAFSAALCTTVLWVHFLLHK